MRQACVASSFLLQAGFGFGIGIGILAFAREGVR
jgi:hypothetical protein